MTVEVIAVGGYEEVGKNMTAVKIGEDVIIFDMGIHLDRISIHEDTDIDRMHSLDLIERGVIPDDTLMKDVDGQVKAIVFSHGHLDHIGAVAKLAHRYNAPIIGTPYTIASSQHTVFHRRYSLYCILLKESSYMHLTLNLTTTRRFLHRLTTTGLENLAAKAFWCLL